MSLATRISDLTTRIGQECKALWTAVNGKASTTDPRLSDQRTPTDDSVTTAKLVNSMKAVVAMTGLDVDFSAGLIFTKNLSANSTLTFSNLQVGVRHLVITANGYALAAPTWINITNPPAALKNTYSVVLTITKATAGSESGIAVLN